MVLIKFLKSKYINKSSQKTKNIGMTNKLSLLID